MGRLDQLREEELVTRLHRVRDAFDALKTSQLATSRNVVARRIVTGNNIDFTTTITYHNVTIWEVTITADDAADSFFFWGIFYNGVTVSGSGTAQVFTEVRASSGGVRKARFCAMGTTPGQSVTYGIRVVVYGIGQATLSIAQIA